MISIVKGNILESKAEALINTVNTQGVMGKGIALQFKKAFPEMFGEYENECKAGRIIIGKMHVWRNDGMFDPKYVINFPTKNDWKHKSKLEYITKGLVDLVRVITDLGITSLAVPPLGCGNGGLDWKVVKPLIIEALRPFGNVHVELYEPSGAPRELSGALNKKVRMTLSRALVLKLFKQYCILGYELTLLEVQKLCYFLQEFGEPLRLRFVKHAYGPYADNVRHVLIDFEGTYTQGFVDGSDNRPDNTIKILPRAVTESEAFIEANKLDISESLRRLSLVERFIEGYETPFGMELLSTVHWVIKHEHMDITQKEEIIGTVHSWNPRKAKLLKPEFINKAITRVAEFCNAD